MRWRCPLFGVSVIRGSTVVVMATFRHRCPLSVTIKTMYIIELVYILTICMDERDAAYTQYITNTGISHISYIIMHCKHDHCVLRLFSFFRLLTQSDSHGIIIPGPLDFPLFVASIYIEAGGRR